ncbi:MAG TPA: hypothetical protein VFQ40_08735 [Actinomycetota bacterium]|nr:hypothetical protein [Actinomycetota bacterium]
MRDDRFNFGFPARRPARLGQPHPPRATTAFGPHHLLLAVGLGAAALVLFVVLRGAGRAGEEVGEARSETMVALDRANDAAAQATLGSAVVIARTAWAERGAFPTDPAGLSAFDASVRFTAGPSSGPTSVGMSVVDDEVFAAAVRSASGTCWWVKLNTSGGTTYGSGGTCTGDAAMAADAPSW